MLTIVIHQRHLVVAHQPAKVEHQQGPTSGKPGSKWLKLAYILRAVSVKFFFKPSILLHDLSSLEAPSVLEHRILDARLSPNPPTYIGLYPPLWATHPAAFLSQFKALTIDGLLNVGY